MLDKIFHPKSIALIGASRTPGKLGYDVLSNLKNLGFRGNLYPVNPKGGNILGLEVLVDIESLPEIPDLTLIAIPAKKVVRNVEECGRVGIKNIVIISAGFKEIGGEGVQREDDLKKVIAKYELNILGPNCLGLINTDILMNASFAEGMPQKGNVSLISQSGAMAVAMIDWAYESGLGFSKIISMGNKAGVAENELLAYLGDDSKTKVILMYLESINCGQDFLALARKISRKKPIIILKSGTSDEGSKAISSHTGALAGSDIAVETAFKQSGIIRVQTAEELFDYAKAFSYQSLPKSNRVAVITNAGGPGIMAADAISRTSLKLVDLSKDLKNKLAEKLPSTASLHNPVDVIGDAPVARYRHAIQTLLESKEVDSVIVILTPQVMTEVKKVATVTTALSQQFPKKTVLSSFMGGENISRGKRIFRRHLFPNYIFPERAVKALARMNDYEVWRKDERKRVKETVTRRRVKNRAQLDKIFAGHTGGKYVFTFSEIKLLTESYGIKMPQVYLAKTVKEAVSLANKFGYPVVMKIVSPDIYHKTDVGGIRIDIKNQEDVIKVFTEIMVSVKEKLPHAYLSGVSVEPMLEIGKEVIIGAKFDSQFGHLLMFGLGGIYVEILKDVTFRIAPVTRTEAFEMVEEIKSIKILKGARGEKPVNLNEIVDVIERVSHIVTDYPQIQEFEINPLIISRRFGTVAVDTNLIL